MPELQTEDLTGIEILRAGGPYHGMGSPPEGDYLTVADLEESARAYRELAGEVAAPVWLGHDSEQALLKNSGLTGADGEPAAGWVENVRVQGSRLVADLKKVPAKVARLLRAGAWRRCSVVYEPSYTSASGQTYRNVITGLGLLGAKLPAVSDLDDLVRLYEDDKATRRTYTYALDAPPGEATLPIAALERAWEPSAARARVLAWAGGDLAQEAVAAKYGQAFLRREGDPASPDSYSFPVADVIDGALTLIPGALYAAAVTLQEGGAGLPDDEVARMKDAVGQHYHRMERVPPWDVKQDDTDPEEGFMPDGGEGTGTATVTVPAELRQALGLPEGASTEAVLEAVKRIKALDEERLALIKELELEESAGLKDITDGLASKLKAQADTERDELDGRVKALEERAQAAEKDVREMRKREVMDGAIREGIIEPGQRKGWEEDFDRDPEMVTRAFSRMPKRQFTREIGNDGGSGEGGEEEKQRKDALYDQWRRRSGGLSAVAGGKE